jgi:UDP-2-acetamido-2,6-beta-L-arabino-hexul-4-ose reductase
LTSGDEPRVVETAPGWAHDITNIGETRMVVMLWANELFDKGNPDTFASEI